MSKKKSNPLLIVLVLTITALTIFYVYYNLNLTNVSILNDVVNGDGYARSLETEEVPLELFIEPDWIAFEEGEKKDLRVPLFEKHQTKIVLDHVVNRGIDIYFTFEADFTMDRQAGEFLYNGIINDDGTITTPVSNIELYDIKMNPFQVGQSGHGYKASFSFGIMPDEQQLIHEGFYVHYDGYNLYRYERN